MRNVPSSHVAKGHFDGLNDQWSCILRNLPEDIHPVPMIEERFGLHLGDETEVWMDWEFCDAARIRRDATYDGMFYTCVKTTGIYCRPVCPVAHALSRNVFFVPSAAAAERAGFRPCLRCRPEAAPGSPAWKGTATTVERGLRLIEEGILDRKSVDDLANRLGIGERHLSRLFMKHIGASPLQVAATRRVQKAKMLVSDTNMPISEIAFAAGFQSLRRFNDAFVKTYGRAPSSFRRHKRRVQGTGTNARFQSKPL